MKNAYITGFNCFNNFLEELRDVSEFCNIKFYGSNKVFVKETEAKLKDIKIMD